MTDLVEDTREVTRITCMVHQQLDKPVMEKLRELGAHTVLLENARCVRQDIRSRLFGLAGARSGWSDSPLEIFRTTVPRTAAARVIRELTDAAELRSPGRGSVYAQDILEICRRLPPEMDPESPGSGTMLHDLTLITGILSRAGSGDTLARMALKLGAGVPVITLGIGTGLRDRLGLLRITIPPDKELIHLIVPSHDAAGVQRLLVEAARMNRPNGGFLYQTRIRTGVIDPLTRIGHQEHSASMEQIIAAMDHVLRGTSWRKRFTGIHFASGEENRPASSHREIVFICPEGRARDYAQAAVYAGAPGVTFARTRCLSFSDVEGGVSARERGIICIPGRLEKPVLDALRDVAGCCNDALCRLQILDVPSVFSHQN